MTPETKVTLFLLSALGLILLAGLILSESINPNLTSVAIGFGLIILLIFTHPTIP